MLLRGTKSSWILRFWVPFLLAVVEPLGRPTFLPLAVVFGVATLDFETVLVAAVNPVVFASSITREDQSHGLR